MADARDVWLVLPEQFSARVFVETGIAGGLEARLGERLRTVFVNDAVRELWVERMPGREIAESELLPFAVSIREKLVRRVDGWVDERFGFWPLAIRLNEREGFHADRMLAGHKVGFLDLSRRGWLPRSSRTDRVAERWHFSTRRYVSAALLRRMRAECGALVVANLQMRAGVPFLNAARRLGIPTVGYVASWDHTVGKGVISSHLDRYVVQNEIMRDDLVRHHGITDDRIVVTGWPQSDVFLRRRARDEYDALLHRLGLPVDRKVVLFAGNSPTNTPYEGRFVARLVASWETGEHDRPSLLFRPHPRDHLWRERYAAALGRPGLAVQEPSYTDIDDLATLLQHVDVAVTSAGTILLDAIVNDRPAICVVYDEGAPEGESWAAKNVIGEHYRELMESGAFPLAESFDDVVRELAGALSDPRARADARRRVSEQVLGKIDGRAADRAVEAMLEVVGR
jgi:CDP-Glycerol:Poly(glycerophosphate) glycerophosphotransferase